MLIGISGKKSAGKDTAGQHFVDAHGFRQIAFADKLKDSVAALFSMPRERVDEYKNNRFVAVEIVEYSDVGDAITYFTEGMSFREFLQRYGTEAHRDVFGEDFWVEQAISSAPIYEHMDTVVTDCRFDSEARGIIKAGGVVIEIVRPEVDDGDAHVSEAGISRHYVDATIHNDSTLERLYEKLDLYYRAISVPN